MSQQPKKYQLFIDGKWTDPAGGEWFESHDPFSGEAWALIPKGNAADVDRAVNAAHKALEGPWAAMSASDRGMMLHRLGALGWVTESTALPRGYNGASRWGDQGAAYRTQDSALLNGVAVHALELDDFHNAELHPGAAIIPAALTIAEHMNADGARLLAAIAAGYEVMIRSSKALNPTAARLRGWHLTGVCGPLGAAAACASLLRLDQTATAWALGLAGTQGSGLWAFTADGAFLHAYSDRSSEKELYNDLGAASGGF